MCVLLFAGAGPESHTPSVTAALTHGQRSQDANADVAVRAITAAVRTAGFVTPSGFTTPCGAVVGGGSTTFHDVLI